MSRSEERKCYYSRWSEPILRRRYSTHLVHTSEEDTSSVRRSRSSSPLRNSLNSPITQFGCCSCRINNYKKKKLPKSRSNNSSKLLKQEKSDESQNMRESLLIQLVGSQVEEALAGDKQVALIQHLEISTDVLDALIQHVHTLQVSQVSAQRVIHLAHQLVLPNPSSSLSTDLATRFRQTEASEENKLLLLREVIENCSKNIILSKHLQSLINDNKMKKEDFNIAAKNFQNLLENSKLTISQMDKLHWQYRAIMDDYKQNRRILDSELPKIIKTRLGAIRQGFCMIAAFYEDTEYPKQISDLFKILGETLCQEGSEASNDDHYIKNDNDCAKKSHSREEICEKCKVNKVEKK